MFECPGIALMTLYKMGYLYLILSCNEGTWRTMTRKASFLIAALVCVVIITISNGIQSTVVVQLLRHGVIAAGVPLEY